MKWEIEVNQQKIVTGAAAELESLMGLTSEAIKEGQGYPCVIDLRKVTEITDKPGARMKELGVRYVPCPMTEETFSEQDMDLIRRECARHWGKLLIVSHGGVRGAFVALAHGARVKGLTSQEALKLCQTLNDHPRWVEHLESYLQRHARVGAAS